MHYLYLGIVLESCILLSLLNIKEVEKQQNFIVVMLCLTGIVAGVSWLWIY